MQMSGWPLLLIFNHHCWSGFKVSHLQWTALVQAPAQQVWWYSGLFLNSCLLTAEPCSMVWLISYSCSQGKRAKVSTGRTGVKLFLKGFNTLQLLAPDLFNIL